MSVALLSEVAEQFPALPGVNVIGYLSTVMNEMRILQG